MPCYAGLYCCGWVKTGPVGVILTTMDNAFETAELIVEDFNQGSQPHEIVDSHCLLVHHHEHSSTRTKRERWSSVSAICHVCS